MGQSVSETNSWSFSCQGDVNIGTRCVLIGGDTWHLDVSLKRWLTAYETLPKCSASHTLLVSLLQWWIDWKHISVLLQASASSKTQCTIVPNIISKLLWSHVSLMWFINTKGKIWIKWSKDSVWCCFGSIAFYFLLLVETYQRSSWQNCISPQFLFFYR